MKKLASQLLREIAECREMSPVLKSEIMEFISRMGNMENSINALGAFVLNTRFITARELIIEEPELLTAMLGYKTGEKPEFSFDDFFSSIHPDDIAQFSEMMDNFYNRKCSCTSGLFRLMNKSGDYIWLFGRACFAGNDTMTGKPKISGILIEVCYKFSTPLNLEILNREYMKRKTVNNRHKFTCKDIEIVKLMIDGHTIDEIAEMMHISSSNLNYRKTKMFDITNTGNAPALINYFISNGLV